MLIFRPFFEKLYKALFGETKKLPKRPKSEKISLLISSSFGGWTIVRHMILQHFGNCCKDPQYLSLVHLLDEVIPLVFYYYVVVFRGGNFDQWLETKFRIAIQFIIFKRKNYDKATLCHLSDVLHHMERPDFLNLMTNSLNLLSEKKIEVFHSKLRR